MDPAWDAAIQRAGLLRVQDTSAILLYLEHLSDARRFVSAARSARETNLSW